MFPISRRSTRTRIIFIVVLTILILGILNISRFKTAGNITGKKPQADLTSYKWLPPDTSAFRIETNAELIRYGRALVAQTANFLGPKGKVMPISNGMNCQNCHLDAGTRLYGNNYSAVYSMYPKFRERSGTVENIYKRVNDCLERSLNGNRLDTNGREMQAIAAYINWVGREVPKEVKPAEAGITEISLLDRAASPALGNVIYQQQCIICHGKDGSGIRDSLSVGYIYPPLWGENSYTTAAGLFRISRFAGFVKDNMPYGASHDSTQITDEQAWDIAAFVNSQPRPEKKFSEDWPSIAGKPFDYPYPPFADGFSEQQHKYGPFGPIKEWISKNKTVSKK